MIRHNSVRTGITVACLGLLCLPASPAVAQWDPTAFVPSGKIIAPFGYGQVVQRLTNNGSATGSAFCASVNPSLKCISVSGGSACSALASPASIVSCNSATTPAVDETAFEPVNCNGQGSGDNGVSGLLGSLDWCLIANYMPERKTDTLYQYDDYVRLGVNKRFGGMVTELYGTDKLDRILQNAGGAVQLSLWAFTASYAPSAVARAYFAVPDQNTPNWTTNYDSTAFSSMSSCLTAHPSQQCSEGTEGPNYLVASPVYPCPGNGGTAGAPFNPIQGVSPTCNWGLSQAAVDSVSSGAPGQVTVSKNGPANYTRSDTMPAVQWVQTSQVQGPAAIITYHMTSTSAIEDTDFQEIPAIFTHQGLGSTLFFYAGSKPYADVAGPVSEISSQNLGLSVLQFPGRPGPFGTGSTQLLSEDWISSCDASEQKCLTIATFSSSAQDAIVSYGTATSYLGIHGFFSLTNHMNRTVTVFLFPYRFDDIVQGRSIRSWIYMFKQDPLYRQ